MIALKKLLMSISYRQVGCWTRAVWIALPIIASFACSPKPETPMGSAEVGRSHDTDVAAVSELVEMYVQSINDVDTVLAGEVWLKSDQVSFINPRGHETGWDAIVENVYEKAMRDSFSKRRLTPRDIAVNLFGDTAVAEFAWVFDATRREDGVAIQTTGRESQVYRRTGSGRWELVHVHYSGRPVEEGQQ